MHATMSPSQRRNSYLTIFFAMIQQHLIKEYNCVAFNFQRANNKLVYFSFSTRRITRLRSGNTHLKYVLAGFAGAVTLQQKLKFSGGGEISLTLSEGQTERGSQVREKCVPTSLLRPDNVNLPAGTVRRKKVAFKSKYKLPRVVSFWVSPQPATSHSGQFVFVVTVEMLSTLGASAVTCATTNGTAQVGLWEMQFSHANSAVF